MKREIERKSNFANGLKLNPKKYLILLFAVFEMFSSYEKMYLSTRMIKRDT